MMEKLIAGQRVSFSPTFIGTAEEFIRVHQFLYSMKTEDQKKSIIKELKSVYKELKVSDIT